MGRAKKIAPKLEYKPVRRGNSYRLQLRCPDGKVISITKPTAEECIQEARAYKLGFKIMKDRKPEERTLEEALQLYIDKKAGNLSPTTIRGYADVKKNRFQTIMRKSVIELKDSDFERAIASERRRGLTDKTIKNAWSLIRTALKDEDICNRTVNININWQISSNPHDFLQPEEIPLFLEKIEGHKFEIAFLLGLHGLRCSEVLGLQRKNIDTRKGIIHINGAKIVNQDGIMEYKPTNKNASSKRDVPILIPRLRELIEDLDIRQNDFIVVVQSETALYHASERVTKSLGLPRIGFHGLRHSFASLCYHKGISEKVTMKLGGWSDAGTMRNIYTHIAESDMADSVSSLAAFFTGANGQLRVLESPENAEKSASCHQECHHLRKKA